MNKKVEDEFKQENISNYIKAKILVWGAGHKMRRQPEDIIKIITNSLLGLRNRKSPRRKLWGEAEEAVKAMKIRD